MDIILMLLKSIKFQNETYFNKELQTRTLIFLLIYTFWKRFLRLF